MALPTLVSLSDFTTTDRQIISIVEGLYGEKPGYDLLVSYREYVAANDIPAFTQALVDAHPLAGDIPALAAETAANFGVSLETASAENVQKAIDFLTAQFTNKGIAETIKKVALNWSRPDTDPKNAIWKDAADAFKANTLASLEYSTDEANTDPEVGGNIGETFVLTTGLDDVVGTDKDDTIQAFIDDVDNTIQGFDVIDGNDGVDTLDITIAGSGDAGLIGTISNVENIEIDTFGTGEDFTLDMALVSDVKNISINVAAPSASSDIELENVGLQLESLTLSGTLTGDTKDTSDGSDMWFDMNTNDSSQVGIEELNINDIQRTLSIEIDNLTNIPVLNLSNIGNGTDDNDIDLTVLDTVATGTDDSLVIVAHNAGLLNTNTSTEINISVDNATGDSDIFENLDITVTGENYIYIEDENGVENVTISGTGDLQMWGNSDSFAAVTMYDASAHSGDLSSSIDVDQSAVVTLGDGDHGFWLRANTDTVDVDLSLTTGSGSTWTGYWGANNAGAVTIDLGAGNDFMSGSSESEFTVDFGAGDDILKADISMGADGDDSFDGGDDTDTIIASSVEFADADLLAALSNFEVLVADTAGSYDMAGLAGITNVVSGGVDESGYGPRYWWDADYLDGYIRNYTGNAAVVFSNVEAGTTLTLNHTNTQAVTYALADVTGLSDAVTVELGNLEDEDVTMGGAADGVVLAGIETITINSTSHALTSTTDTVDTNTIVELAAANVTKLVITGDANLDIDGIDIAAGGTVGTTAALALIDASAATGNVTFLEASDSTGSIQYIGSQGVDTYIGTLLGDTINAGTGADDITLGAAGASDTLIIRDGDSGVDAAAMDTYATFVTTEDAIDLGSFGFTGTQSSALFSLGAIATLPADGDADVADFFNSAGVDRAVAWGTNGGNTYVYVDANGDGDLNVDTDVAFELTGIATVALADFGF